MHQFTGYVLFLAASMGVPMRLAHSRLDTRVLDRSASLPRKTYIRLMDFLVRRYATRGLAITESAAASLFSESWKDDPRWAMCPTGIDFDPFEGVVDRSTVRAELGIAQDAFVVGHVGRFAEQKNHRFLVEIAADVIRQEPRTVFLLVGDGALRPSIEAMVRLSGLSEHFLFTGNRRDVPRLMKGAMDCFVFPSFYEGLGRVAWEAQAAGLPCLLSDTIPDEARIAPSLLRRLSLATPARDWANALLETSRISREAARGVLTDIEMASIDHSRRVVESIYSEVRGQR
jgi:glycosyltransferase involved in cell wall biosynthesis